MTRGLPTFARVTRTAVHGVSQASLRRSSHSVCRHHHRLSNLNASRTIGNTRFRPFTCSALTWNGYGTPFAPQTDTTSVSKSDVSTAKDGAEQSRFQVLTDEAPYKNPERAPVTGELKTSTQTDTTSVAKSDVDTANKVAEHTPPYETQPEEPRLSLTFTCTVSECDTRSTHEFTKRSYERGIVIVQCPGCKNRHLIADHLSWFKDSTEDGKLRTIEDLMKAKGEKVRRGATDGSLTLEYAPE
ncbi:DNL zinc finger-domain-containing protein [Cytidiella melzeri]|nr:DNL zinc finger-domain-containing protein [Cytidiella melzeri]